MNIKIKFKFMYHFRSENRTPISANGFNRPLGLTRIIKSR